MAELCLMASHAYPIGFHSDHVSNKLPDDFHHFLPYHGSNQDLLDPISFNSGRKQKEERRVLDSNRLLMLDSTSKMPMFIDFQDSCPDSILLSLGIAERCMRHERLLKLLLSSKSIEEQGQLDLSMLYDMMGPTQSPVIDFPQQSLCFNDAQPLQNLVHPTQELYLNEPFLGQPPCTCTDAEMSEVLSVISNFYTPKNSNKSCKQTMLVPFFERRKRAQAKNGASKLAAAETASLKSHDKLKEKTSQKKTNARTVKGRDIYSDSYLHACESLLSTIAGRKLQGKNVILSLKKSGPQLPHLLTQISASIAGTGIAVVVSVICRVACSRVPFCGSRALSTGLGLGLVWLSWAVNKLRDTVVTISRSSGKVREIEEEMMMGNLDRNLKDICVGAAALMLVVVLKVA